MMVEGFCLSNVVSFFDYFNIYKERSGFIINYNFIGYFICKSNLYFLYVFMIVEVWVILIIYMLLFVFVVISLVIVVLWLFVNDIEN